MIESETISYIETRRLWAAKRRVELDLIAPLTIGQNNETDIEDAFMMHIPVNWPDGSPLLKLQIGGESGIIYSHMKPRKEIKDTDGN